MPAPLPESVGHHPINMFFALTVMHVALCSHQRRLTQLQRKWRAGDECGKHTLRYWSNIQHACWGLFSVPRCYLYRGKICLMRRISVKRSRLMCRLWFLLLEWWIFSVWEALRFFNSQDGVTQNCKLVLTELNQTAALLSWLEIEITEGGDFNLNVKAGLEPDGLLVKYQIYCTWNLSFKLMLFLSKRMLAVCAYHPSFSLA